MTSTLDSSSALPLPYRFGRYRLSKLIAVGGMAQIYLARSYGAEGFVKPLVIKRLDPKLAADERFMRLFVDEAKMLVSLNHGNIVPVFDFGRVENDLYMAMEFIRGPSLRELVEALGDLEKPLDHQVAAYIAAEICKGLDYAHRKTDDRGRPAGIVHRDIKPTNILISVEGEVKIVDFGVAKLAHRPSEGELTGTVAYMSPEQANLRSVDLRTDIFSTGLVLYELLALTQAYDGPSAKDVLKVARKADLAPLGPHIPTELRAIVERATAKEPDQRYRTAHDMEHDLTEYQVLARSVGSTVDSEPMATRLSTLLGSVTEFGLSEPLFDDKTGEATVQGADPPTAPTVQYGDEQDSDAESYKNTEAHTDTESFAETESYASVHTSPPDLVLIRDAAETFHSEFISHLESPSDSVVVAPKSSASRWLLIGTLLFIVFGAGVGSALLLRAPSPVATSGAQKQATARATSDYQHGHQEARTPHVPADVGTPSRKLTDASEAKAPPIKVPKVRRRPRKYGTLNLSSIPWSRVSIGGRRYKRPTPLMGLRLRAGTHVVTLENRRRRLRKVVRIRITAGQTVSKVVRLKP